MAKAPTMSQVKIFCENNAIVWQSAPGWSWRGRDPEETGQGVKEIITKTINYLVSGEHAFYQKGRKEEQGEV